ncbi:MAG: hypothetical protein PHN69_02935 [Candidatus Pacebacteria bacterium]|nr:hypothetical protein [Candidatus Paceibacterota bacterium]
MEREELVAAAKELNEVMGLAPAINLKAKKKELVTQMRLAIAEIVPTDIFSDKTTEIVKYYQDRASKAEAKQEEEMEDTEVEEEVVEVKTKKDEVEKAKIETGKEMKHIKVKQEVDEVEKEVTDFEDSFDKALEEEMKGPRKKTLKQKQEAEKSTKAKENKLLVLERRTFVSKLIEKGKFTKAEIMDKALAEYPEWNKVSLSTMLTDGSNPKYNVFESLVVKDTETKILSFAKE